MRKLNGAVVALNRKAFLVLSVMLSLGLFGVVAWRIDAQNATEKSEKQRMRAEAVARLTPAKQARILADEQYAIRTGPVEPASATYAPEELQGNPVIFAYNSETDHLISFNANTPDVLLTDIEVTGIDIDNSEFLSNIDFRPSGGALYAVATKGFSPFLRDRLVTVNTTTGAVTSVNAANNFASTIDRASPTSTTCCSSWASVATSRHPVSSGLSDTRR